MKKVFVGLFICIACLSVGSISALAEIDEYGNEIDWNVNDIGNEDAAGGEINYVPINADQLETEREVMTSDESEAVKEIVNTTMGSDGGKTGIIIASFIAPEDWRGSNVVLTVYPLDVNGLPRSTEKKSIYLYRQNDYVAREELAVGRYQVYQASVVGDRGNVFPMVTDIAEFTVEEGGVVVNINIELAGVNDYLTGEEENVSETVIPEPVIEKKENKLAEFVKDNTVFVAICLVLFIIYIILKRKEE